MLGGWARVCTHARTHPPHPHLHHAGLCLCNPTSCCWTSPPTTWTSTPCCGSKTTWSSECCGRCGAAGVGGLGRGVRGVAQAQVAPTRAHSNSSLGLIPKPHHIQHSHAGGPRPWWSSPTRAPSSTPSAPTSSTSTHAPSWPTRYRHARCVRLRAAHAVHTPHANAPHGRSRAASHHTPPTPPASAPPITRPRPPPQPALQGNYDVFEKTAAERLRNARAAAESQQMKRDHMKARARARVCVCEGGGGAWQRLLRERSVRACATAGPPPPCLPPAPAQAFIDKFRYNAKRASLVQSRIKALERLAGGWVEGGREGGRGLVGGTVHACMWRCVCVCVCVGGGGWLALLVVPPSPPAHHSTMHPCPHAEVSLADEDPAYVFRFPTPPDSASPPILGFTGESGGWVGVGKGGERGAQGALDAGAAPRRSPATVEPPPDLLTHTLHTPSTRTHTRRRVFQLSWRPHAVPQPQFWVRAAPPVHLPSPPPPFPHPHPCPPHTRTPASPRRAAST